MGRSSQDRHTDPLLNPPPPSYTKENNEFDKLKNLPKLGFLFGTPERYSRRQPVIRTSAGLFVTKAK
ncbi:hypothetical protein MTR67_026823 [Solanum verrucosum]|uniref:Uncharacterized protein n=1 Tax=Solanum verrucosum TaxID=315347 RepID=A0AAF0R3N4_SOLVR|nr:hypothetical protein MTR67_026823 [Solanum verrucosum]